MAVPAAPFTAGQVARAILRASATIDSHLATRYDIPLSGVPADIVGLCAELAWCYLNRYRGNEPGATADSSSFAARIREIESILDEWANDRVHPQLQQTDHALPYQSRFVDNSALGPGGVIAGFPTMGRDS